MNKYNNPRLLNAVVSGTGMKHPIQPHVVVGDVSNGFIRGDLMDANAIVDLVNSGDAIDQETIRQAVADIIGTAPENLDTLGEVAETLTDMQDPTVEGSLANQISVINTTIEDNELTIAAALNDLNSRLLELVTRVDALDGGGDTPEETPVKVAAESSGQYWIGKYEKLPGSNPIVLMGCEMNTSNLTLVNSTGTVLASGANPINLVEERIKSQMAAAGKSVEEVQVWHIKVTSGSQIENWDTYISV